MCKRLILCSLLLALGVFWILEFIALFFFRVLFLLFLVVVVIFIFVIFVVVVLIHSSGVREVCPVHVVVLTLDFALAFVVEVMLQSGRDELVLDDVGNQHVLLKQAGLRLSGRLRLDEVEEASLFVFAVSVGGQLLAFLPVDLRADHLDRLDVRQVEVALADNLLRQDGVREELVGRKLEADLEPAGADLLAVFLGLGLVERHRVDVRQALDGFGVPLDAEELGQDSAIRNRLLPELGDTVLGFRRLDDELCGRLLKVGEVVRLGHDGAVDDRRDLAAEFLAHPSELLLDLEVRPRALLLHLVALFHQPGEQVQAMVNGQRALLRRLNGLLVFGVWPLCHGGTVLMLCSFNLVTHLRWRAVSLPEKKNLLKYFAKKVFFSFVELLSSNTYRIYTLGFATSSSIHRESKENQESFSQR